MKKIVVFEENEFDQLPLKIIDAILHVSKMRWGFKLISRETGKEEEELSIKGLLHDPIRKVLSGSNNENNP